MKKKKMLNIEYGNDLLCYDTSLHNTATGYRLLHTDQLGTLDQPAQTKGLDILPGIRSSSRGQALLFLFVTHCCSDRDSSTVVRT